MVSCTTFAVRKSVTGKTQAKPQKENVDTQEILQNTDVVRKNEETMRGGGKDEGREVHEGR